MAKDTGITPVNEETSPYAHTCNPMTVMVASDRITGNTDGGLAGPFARPELFRCEIRGGDLSFIGPDDNLRRYLLPSYLLPTSTISFSILTTVIENIR